MPRVSGTILNTVTFIFAYGLLLLLTVVTEKHSSQLDDYSNYNVGVFYLIEIYGYCVTKFTKAWF